MSGIAGLALDVLIVVLLAVTIGYCWLLNRRIRILQDSKSELALLLGHFDESTERASESIVALQTASKKIGENISLRIDKANYLLDDLSYMIEKGTKLADQMEAGFAVNRARAKVIAEEPARQETEVQEERPAERPLSQREKASASLEAVLERVVSRARQPANDVIEAPQEKPAARPRSRTEQELLEMIKAGIKG